MADSRTTNVPSTTLNLTYGDHGKMLVLLWHDDSPGTKFVTRPGLLRRLGIVRSPFATMGETRRHYREMCERADREQNGAEGRSTI